MLRKYISHIFPFLCCIILTCTYWTHMLACSHSHIGLISGTSFEKVQVTLQLFLCVSFSGTCFAMLCYTMRCYAMLCSAMLCYAMLCYAMLCYAMLCYAMLRYAMLCDPMLCYAFLCSISQTHCTLYSSRMWVCVLSILQLR